MCVCIYNISSLPSSPRSQRYASNPVLVKYEIIANMGRKFFFLISLASVERENPKRLRVDYRFFDRFATTRRVRPATPLKRKKKGGGKKKKGK